MNLNGNAVATVNLPASAPLLEGTSSGVASSGVASSEGAPSEGASSDGAFAAASSFVLRVELMFLNHREGLLPDQVWEAQVNGMRHVLTLPIMQRWFSESGSMVHADFRHFVEELTRQS